MFFRIRDLAYLGPNYSIRICRMRQAHEDRQAYDMTYDIFSDVHNNLKSCRGPVVSRCRMRQILPCKSALTRYTYVRFMHKQKVTKTGSIIGHKIDDKGVGVLRG